MGKYVSVNELSTFVFHDAIMAGLASGERDMVWHVENLGVCSYNSQNDHLAGRMIKKAKVTLHNFTFMPFYHPNTGTIPAVTMSELARYVHDSMPVFSFFFEVPSGEQEILCGDVEWIPTQFVSDDEVGLFNFSIHFSQLTVEWDEFGGPGRWENRP